MASKVGRHITYWTDFWVKGVRYQINTGMTEKAEAVEIENELKKSIRDRAAPHRKAGRRAIANARQAAVATRRSRAT